MTGVTFSLAHYADLRRKDVRMSDNTWIIIAVITYFAVMLGIGYYGWRKTCLLYTSDAADDTR